MNGDVLSRWREVWERKGKEKKGMSLQELIEMDGFDKGAGRMTEEMLLKTADVIIKEMELTDGESLLEVGCGCGAMLLAISTMVKLKLSGVDFSSSLIQVAKRVLPDFNGYVSEAVNLPFPENEFGKILSHGVFHYFPDYNYAQKVLKEILRVLKKTGKILIMDIPDLSKREDSERCRMESLSREEYERLYSEYPHLYYEKKWFRDFADNNGLSCKIFDQQIEGYGNSPFRYNVLMWREER